MADLSQEKVEVQGLQQAELRQRHFLSLEEFASTPAAHRQRVKRGVCTLADGRQQRWVCQSDLLVDDIPHQALLHRSVEGTVHGLQQLQVQLSVPGHLPFCMRSFIHEASQGEVRVAGTQRADLQLLGLHLSQRPASSGHEALVAGQATRRLDLAAYCPDLVAHVANIDDLVDHLVAVHC